MPIMVPFGIWGISCCICLICSGLPGFGIVYHSSPPKNPLIMGFISIICSRPRAS